ncbi:MAG TPA: hypothetical protein VH597_16530 [Verrucomicrobiae bacterium]|jgi:hypothetical protein|nr:hypothetical protein [Verrucomicrobiae bacterium]
MKINRTILATVLGLSVAGASQAGTVYLTGSTAARGTVQLALNTAGIVFQSAPTFTGYEGDNYMGFVGNDLSGNPLTVKCHWSGSEAGIKDVALAQSSSFIADSALNASENGSAEPAATETATVDLGMADNAQSFSRTKTPVVNTNAQVGVITFAWVRNNGLWQGTNVSSSQIKQALAGFAPRSVFSGNPADKNDYVYVSGRDFSSGTRVNAYGDTGFGILTPPSQIEIDTASGNLKSDTDINGAAGVFFGDIGWPSGGTLANTLGVSTSGKDDSQALGDGTTGYSVIAYLSRGDANTAITAGGKECTYNGVSFSRNGIIEGNYTFWGYEFIFQRSGAGAQAQAAYAGLKTGVPTAAGHTSASLIPVNDMDCTRSGPNGGVAHK